MHITCNQQTISQGQENAITSNEDWDSRHQIWSSRWPRKLPANSFDVVGCTTLYKFQVFFAMGYSPLVWSSWSLSHLSLFDKVKERTRRLMYRRVCMCSTKPTDNTHVIWHHFEQNRKKDIEATVPKRLRPQTTFQLKIPFARTEMFSRSFFLLDYNYCVMDTNIDRARSMKEPRRSITG